MSSASMTFGRPTRLVIPRGALWFGNFTAFLLNSLQKLDQWQLRVQRPEPQTAEEVLAWAKRIERNEPGFAADLRAAAMRSMDDKRA